MSGPGASSIVDELEEIGSDLRGIASVMTDLGERTGSIESEGVGYLAGHLRCLDRRVHDLVEVVMGRRTAS